MHTVQLDELVGHAAVVMMVAEWEKAQIDQVLCKAPHRERVSSLNEITLNVFVSDYNVSIF